jgi:phospholipid/cholesterol/gamma-HCH transport system permease protein
VGKASLFVKRFFVEVFTTSFEFKEFVWQCYAIGYRSLRLWLALPVSYGFGTPIQSRPTLAQFGAESWIPGMVTLSLVREIAPVITALICAGKIASGIKEPLYESDRAN